MTSRTAAQAGAAGQHRLQGGEVEGEEQVLDDDDAEDQPRLGVGEALQLHQQLGHDRRRGDPDGAGDDERLAPAPTERKPEQETAADVEREVGRAGGEQARTCRRDVVERELQTEVEQQQHQAERGEQLEVMGLVDQADPGRVGPADDAGEHEQRDRRQTDRSPGTGQDRGREEGAAEGDQLVAHAPLSRRPR